MKHFLAALMLSGPVACAAAQTAPLPSHEVEPYQAPTIQTLTGETLREYEAPEADQGVAVDDTFFYPIDNSVIGKYRLDTGELVARFAAPAKGLLRHMNSCKTVGDKLWCANSNYSLKPMGSSVEVFDTSDMSHAASHSLGMMDEGSLTFLDTLENGRLAGFAHYSGKGGLDFKDATFASIVTFDEAWRRTGGWMFPASVIDRMAPYAASGGAIGPDGLLYILGHDRPEMYVLAKPAMGPVMLHVATIVIEAEGQAFSWATDGSRSVYTIDRRKGLVRHIALPDVEMTAPEMLRFR
ncbi:hypothetical protein [Henriciella litoralis]|uniref:hypothetical protein n=1 Tax=Henriciella litoralis TaxID=568102 RepID=UPI0009FF5706|nr:hypothetical protein [Henriciella litoralis]